MKRRYVFMGSLPAHVMGVVSFTSFGQRVELEDAMARDAALGGCVIVPEPVFEELGFTADELKKFGPFGAHEWATPEFVEKKRAAVAAYDKVVATLEEAA